MSLLIVSWDFFLHSSEPSYEILDKSNVHVAQRFSEVVIQNKSMNNKKALYVANSFWKKVAKGIYLFLAADSPRYTATFFRLVPKTIDGWSRGMTHHYQDSQPKKILCQEWTNHLLGSDAEIQEPEEFNWARTQNWNSQADRKPEKKSIGQNWAIRDEIKIHKKLRPV